MLNSIVVALSVIFGQQAPNDAITGTYNSLTVVQLHGKSGRMMTKFVFSNPVYFSKKINGDFSCKVLNVYAGSYERDKWSNGFLARFDYSQFDALTDKKTRKNLGSIADKAFFDIVLEGGVKYLGACNYYADAIDSGIYNSRTRYFRFGYIPVKMEGLN